MKVPFLDLKAQYMSIREEIHLALQSVLNDTAFAGGKYVAQFEAKFADYCKADFAIGVNSGTSALWLALLGLGVGPGDEVITVPSTFIATAEAISYCGAKPVFVDIDEQTYNMNAELLEAAITERTRAIIPVHLFGQSADLDPILTIARRHSLWVIEDACQAHGAEYKGQRVGAIGDAGCFSFYPGKNLGAYGEAGAVVTNNAKLAEKIRMLRDHGQSKKYYHQMIGWNARMEGFQGAILEVKLKYLNAWNNARRQHAQLYRQLLAEIPGVIPPVEADYARHIYHVYAIRVSHRDELIKFLAEKDVQTGIHYPVPVHLQQAYDSLGLRPGSYPVAERCAREFLSLPMYPELTDAQIEYTVQQIRQFMEQRTNG
ncbi:MAG: DegT/DnrJ/EryC1/StrS family aminotransferase [candidate division KSB1 bacterium]|nr:DegT/DnrJ/EryC1/StrS family aminotransferase [candidate division KSB1 bacterium]MDZ7358987.1 DegT/DnrJ/EryC1/StrS family aminotransferase [candidate division KSB1 bacterium]